MRGVPGNVADFLTKRETFSPPVGTPLNELGRTMRPVFQTILENATRICEAQLGGLNLREGNDLRAAATYGAPPEWIEYRRQNPVFRPGPKTGLGRVMHTKQTVQIEDIMSDRALADGDPLRVAFEKLVGARTFLAVPMLEGDDLVGMPTCGAIRGTGFMEYQRDCRITPA
jgi:GAF domain-containing protein